MRAVHWCRFQVDLWSLHWSLWQTIDTDSKSIHLLIVLQELPGGKLFAYLHNSHHKWKLYARICYYTQNRVLEKKFQAHVWLYFLYHWRWILGRLLSSVELLRNGFNKTLKYSVPTELDSTSSLIQLSRSQTQLIQRGLDNCFKYPLICARTPSRQVRD